MTRLPWLVVARVWQGWPCSATGCCADSVARLSMTRDDLPGSTEAVSPHHSQPPPAPVPPLVETIPRCHHRSSPTTS
jgi:hypothetical protein